MQLTPSCQWLSLAARPPSPLCQQFSALAWSPSTPLSMIVSFFSYRSFPLRSVIWTVPNDQCRCKPNPWILKIQHWIFYNWMMDITKIYMDHWTFKLDIEQLVFNILNGKFKEIQYLPYARFFIKPIKQEKIIFFSSSPLGKPHPRL